MLGSPLLFFKGMRLLMFQLSGFYYTLEQTPTVSTRLPTFSGFSRGLQLTISV